MAKNGFNPGASLPVRRRSLFPVVVLVLIVAFFAGGAWWVVKSMEAPPEVKRATLMFDICQLPAPLTIDDVKWEVVSSELTVDRVPAADRGKGVPGTLSFSDKSNGTFTADIGGTATLRRVPDGKQPTPHQC